MVDRESIDPEPSIGSPCSANTPSQRHGPCPGPYPIEETVFRGHRFPGRAPPLSLVVAAVSARRRSSQLLQAVEGLALGPACHVFMDDEEIRRVENRHLPLCLREERKPDLGRLLVKLKNCRVILHQIDERQFDTVASRFTGGWRTSAALNTPAFRKTQPRFQIGVFTPFSNRRYHASTGPLHLVANPCRSFSFLSSIMSQRRRCL